MAAGLPTITSQEPTDLGGGFEDPMDPCTMCQQGQMEIQQAYNDLTSTCNACQTQQNLKQLQTQGCQGCAQAQQVIQNVQQQGQGCASCGGQPTMFTQQMQPQMTQQGQLFTSQQSMMPQVSQGLVQPMLTPLTGTGQQMLTTVMQQPGMRAGQLPIAIERGPNSPTITTPQTFIGSQLGMPVMPHQPIVVGGGGMMTPMPMQPVVTGMIPTPPPMPMQPVNIPPPPMAPAPVMQPVMQPSPIMQPAPPPPVQQPVMQPVPMQPSPLGVQLSPAQVAGLQAYAANLSKTVPQVAGGGIQITGVGGATQGYGAGGGKAGPGSGTTIGIGPEGFSGYQFAGSGGGLTYGGTGGGFGGIGGPGAFDTHRPDLHAGGGWHMTMPLGTESIFNLL